MKFTVQLTPEDCIAARWIAFRPRRTLSFVGFGLLALMIVVLVWQVIEFAGGQPFRSSFWWLLAALAYLGLTFFVLMPRRIRKIYRQQTTLHSPFEVELGESHFSVVSQRGSFSIPWSELHKWKIGRKCLLIYQSEASMNVIPCRIFASDAERDSVVQLLSAKMGKPKP